jgi:hypothetical protein
MIPDRTGDLTGLPDRLLPDTGLFAGTMYSVNGDRTHYVESRVDNNPITRVVTADTPRDGDAVHRLGPLFAALCCYFNAGGSLNELRARVLPVADELGKLLECLPPWDPNWRLLHVQPDETGEAMQMGVDIGNGVASYLESGFVQVFPTEELLRLLRECT